MDACYIHGDTAQAPAIAQLAGGGSEWEIRKQIENKNVIIKCVLPIFSSVGDTNAVSAA